VSAFCLNRLKSGKNGVFANFICKICEKKDVKIAYLQKKEYFCLLNKKVETNQF
jgi:hypothetical protein